MQVALGLRIAQSRGMLNASDDNARDDENIYWARCEIVWTLFMMDRIFVGHNISHPSVSASSFHLAPYSKGPRKPGAVTGSRTDRHMTPRESSDNNRSLARPKSIIAVNIDLLKIWELAMVDIFEARSGRLAPFWEDSSPRSKIESRLLEFETNGLSRITSFSGMSALICLCHESTSIPPSQLRFCWVAKTNPVGAPSQTLL